MAGLLKQNFQTKKKKNWSENEKKGNSDRIVGKAGNKTRNVKANREETKANKRR